MFRNKWLLLFIAFLLLQIPLVMWFSKDPSFEDMKWKISFSECAIVSFLMFIALLWQPSPQKTASQQTSQQVDEAQESLEKEYSVLLSEKDKLAETSKELETKRQLLEKELEEVQKERSHLQEELQSLKMAQKQFEGQFQLCDEIFQKLGKALFSEFEDLQEMRRQHMIEMRALLRKEAPTGSKEASSERKTGLSLIPKKTASDPLVLLSLIRSSVQKRQNQSNQHLLERRKFFDELQSLQPLPFLCLSISNPGDSIISPQFQQDEAKSVLEWIRTHPKEWEGNTKLPIKAQCTPDKTWILMKLSSPFEDLFLCFTSSS